MTAFRIYGQGPALAYPTSGGATFVDATVKALLDGDRSTAVVVDGSRVLFLFLGRDPAGEDGWQRYVAEYAPAAGGDPVDLLAGLARELDKLRLDDWGWTCHPRDEAWLDALSRTVAAPRTGDVAMLGRLADDTGRPLSFGMSAPDRALGVAAALARGGATVVVADGDRDDPPAVADVVLRPDAGEDFRPLTDGTRDLWEWKRGPLPEPEARGPGTGAHEGGDGEHASLTPTRTAAEPADRPPPRPDNGQVPARPAPDGGGSILDNGSALVSREGRDGLRVPSVPVPGSVTAVALALALVVIAGLAVGSAVVLGSGPFGTGAGDGSAAAPATGGSDPVVTLSASVSGSTVSVRGGGSGDVTLRLVDGATGETVATRQVDAGGNGFRAEFTDRAAGTYRVVADTGETTVEERVRVEDGGAALELDAPAPGGTIESGTLRIRGRASADSVTIRVESDGTTVTQTETPVDDGRFGTEIAGLRDGRYRVVVTGGGERATRSITVG